MKTFLLDRLALIMAATGMILMVFTIVLQVNPVDSSVASPLVKGSVLGNLFGGFLYVTCMPVFLVTYAVWTCLSLPTDWGLAATICMIVIQGLTFFLMGKILSVSIKTLRRKDRVSPK